jgi:alpha-tubulin suppressor-like RCC1 family protein
MNKNNGSRFPGVMRIIRCLGFGAIMSMSLNPSAVSGAGGRLAAWGRNTGGETNPPPHLTNLVAISIGSYHGLALRADGTVASWGSRTNVPAGLSDVIQIASGGYNSIALRSNGKVAVWGDTGSGAYYTNFADGLRDIVSVAAGDIHFAALKNDGTVVVWAAQGAVTNVPSSATNVAMLAAAANYCIALRDDGTLVAWGVGPTNIPVAVTNVASIAAGLMTAGAIRRDGAVVTWNFLGGVTPHPAVITNMAALALGTTYGLGLGRDGTIVPWERGTYGETNVPTGLSNFVAVATGLDFSAGLMATNPLHLWHLSSTDSNIFSGQPVFFRVRALGQPPLVYQWQFNGTDIIGATNADYVLRKSSALDSGLYRVVVSNALEAIISDAIPLQVADVAPFISQQPSNVETNLFAHARLDVTADGSRPLSYRWFSNGVSLAGATSPTFVVSNLQVTQSGLFTVVVSNAFGTVSSLPAAVTVRPVLAWGIDPGGPTNNAPGITNVSAIAAADAWNFALRREGTVVQWGPGFGSTGFAGTLSNIVQLSAHGGQNLALAADGRVMAWGIVANTPFGLDEVAAISAGVDFCAALKYDGRIVTWGNNEYGQLHVPPVLIDAVEIAAGNYHGVAIRRDGTVRGWGGNDQGRAEAPAGLSNIVAVAAGAGHSLALRDDGLVFAWGSNFSGQTNLPMELSNVVAIAAGGDHSIALLRDGTISEWGGVRFGVPQAVSNVVAMAGGANHFLVLIGQGPPFVRRSVAPRKAVFSGERIRLSVEAVGQWPLSYQWRANGADIPGATNTFHWLSNVQVTDSFSYSVVVSNALGSTTTELPSIQVVEQQPRILVQPVPRFTNFTGSVDFEVACTGSQPLQFQWLHNGDPIPDATHPRLRLQGLSLRQAGVYSVSVSNALGVATSSNATLSISPLVAWGCSDVCPTVFPTNSFGVVALAAGQAHALALKSDGTVLAWGQNNEGQATVPFGLRNVSAISACENQSLALRSDGTVVGWGLAPSPPADLRGVVAISAGEWHNLAIKSNGEVVSWGYSNIPRTNVPPSATNALGGAGSRYHSAIFRRDGSVTAWNPDSGLPVPTPPELQNVVAMAAHLTGISALRSDGSVVLWGDGYSPSALRVLPGDFVSHSVGYAYSLGITPLGRVAAFQSLPDWELPLGLQDVVAVAAGGYQAVAVSGSGRPLVRVLPSGDSTAYSGQKLLLRVKASGEFPLRYQWLLNGIPLEEATNSTFFGAAPPSAGDWSYSVAVSNNLGTTNVHVASYSVVDSPPFLIDQPDTIGANVFSNALFSVVADGSGPLLYQWYFNGEQIPLATNASLSLTALWPTQTGVYQVLVSNRFGAVASAPAELQITPVVAWGVGAYNQTSVPPGFHQISAVSAGARHVLALNSEGTIVRWGNDFSGRTNIPPDTRGIVDIAAGRLSEDGSASMGLRQDGVVIEWDFSPAAQSLYYMLGAKVISAGYGFRAALTENGRVIVWGANNVGQTNVPLGLPKAVAVSAGTDHCLALLSDGSVKAWGNTNYGVLSTAGLTAVKAIAAGGSFSLALRSNGTVVAWGRNEYGQTNVPVGLNDVIAIAAGPRHSMALRSNGTVVAWGDVQFEALSVPVGLSNVVAISAGEQYCVALIESPLIHRRLLEPSLSGSRYSAKFPAFSGRRFLLEATDSLSDTHWSPIAFMLGQGGLSTLSHTNVPPGQRFYRLRRE